MIDGFYVKLKVVIIVLKVKDNTFPIRLEIIQGYLVSQFLFNIILKVLDSGIRDRKKKRHTD